MKAILFGASMILLVIIIAIFTGDGTIGIFFVPAGIAMIREGIKNGDAIWEEEA